MKSCPFCKEPIQEEAVKCKHCHEWLDKPTLKKKLGGLLGASRLHTSKAPLKLSEEYKSVSRQGTESEKMPEIRGKTPPPLPADRGRRLLKAAKLFNVLAAFGLVMRLERYHGIITQDVPTDFQDPSLSALFSSPSMPDLGGTIGYLIGINILGVTAMVLAVLTLARSRGLRGRASLFMALIIIILVCMVEITAPCKAHASELNTSVPHWADAFDIGGKTIRVSPPQGYERVTEEMAALRQYVANVTLPQNDLLAFYVTEADAHLARQGEVPPFERWFVLTVNTGLRTVSLDRPNFAKLKSAAKRQVQDAEKTVGNDSIPSAEMTPFPIHYETEDALAFSMYIDYGEQSEITEGHLVRALTTTFANVSGKVVSLWCYGTKDNLEWTRTASAEWLEKIVAANPEAPPVARNLRLYEAVDKGIIAFAAVVVFLLVYSVVRSLKYLLSR